MNLVEMSDKIIFTCVQKRLFSASGTEILGVAEHSPGAEINVTAGDRDREGIRLVPERLDPMADFADDGDSFFIAPLS